MMTPAKRAAMDAAIWRLPLAAVCLGLFAAFLLSLRGMDHESVDGLTSCMTGLAIYLALMVGIYQAFCGIWALQKALVAMGPKPPVECTDWHHSRLLLPSGRDSQTFEDARIPGGEAPLPIVRSFLFEVVLVLVGLAAVLLFMDFLAGGDRARESREALYVGTMFALILAQLRRVTRVIRAAGRLALGMTREEPHVHLSVEPVRPGDTIHVSYIPNRHFPVASATMRVVCLEMVATDDEYAAALTAQDSKDEEKLHGRPYSEEIAKVENTHASGHIPLLEGNVTIPGNAMHTFQLPGGLAVAGDKLPRIVWGIEVLLKRAGKKERREFHAFRVL